MKKILFLVVFICFFIVIILLSNREGIFKTKMDLSGNSYMDDVHIIQRREGVVKWTLGSKKAIFINQNDVKLYGLQITFPDRELTLNSEGGMYDIEKRDLTIEGRIKASTSDYDILTDKLYLDASKNELFTDNRVRIIGKKFYVEGDGMVAVNDKATLKKNVKAIFYYEKK